MLAHETRFMVTITITISDELSAQLDQMRDQLPELLALSLQQPPLPAHIYRTILEFLSTNPTPAQIVAFVAPSDMQERIRSLLARSKEGKLTSAEEAELDEYERIEHMMVMIKSKSLSLPRTG